MNEKHLWNRAKSVSIDKAEDIMGEFNIGFDDRIPECTKDALIHFVYWVEDHFSLPVTLWVDFKYNHYLLDCNHKRVGYKFYWVDFENYPVFYNEDDIPVIELPVRTDHYTMEEILTSFIEAISLYFTWLTNTMQEGFKPDVKEVDDVLQAYFQFCSQETKNGMECDTL